MESYEQITVAANKLRVGDLPLCQTDCHVTHILLHDLNIRSSRDVRRALVVRFSDRDTLVVHPEQLFSVWRQT